MLYKGRHHVAVEGYPTALASVGLALSHAQHGFQQVNPAPRQGTDLSIPDADLCKAIMRAG